MIPIGYTQSAGSNPLLPNPQPLQLSVVGNPTPGSEFQRRRNIQRAIFPGKYGPLVAGR